MSYFGGLISTLFERRYQQALSDEVDSRTTCELCEALLSSHGEVSGVTLARNLLDRYAAMTEAEKTALFGFMAHDLEIDPDAVTHTLEAYKNNPGKDTYRAFAAACEPRRQELARRLNQVPGATGQLVQMRKDLLRMMKDHPDLEPVDVDFKHLFSSWFNRGFLVLRPIDWSSPANILEQIIAYEAVHEIDSWDELRRRLQPSDRRCFGFFHPSMADEPLIFVEVALTEGVPSSVQDLLADERDVITAQDADTAVFYSISNCQSGLAGISFGNSLIKQVVADLAKDLPGLTTFVTLSPIPGLNRWLQDADIDALKDADTQALAAHYLLEAKRSDGMPFDPVARFHLGNGALVHAVHAEADVSPNGRKQSNGAMVNYLYDLSQISQNHEKFVGDKIVVASTTVKALSGSVTTSLGT
ncbi:decarboxylase [Roseobacter denitrificans]|uniref:Malonyl-CoA decarboxylase n=1 Tax=Roseobacter denitrificans (strain ATCC 33942 / OCh 114) TaxID=375451 RepID=Q16A85_ROSDO|nr:malonyl-CoA decarboxylase [Roseobacter denitrificans]ABG31108.1 malonyl-CoA decarboxylase [Roseobacter denitrificans OCh 114]AVL54179.1 decarboxylase [Roseobacter denitrificans]SFG32755.1 malonyl-CoA decarboxylase [Roseobacter denitrificans OCh 114]